MGLTVHPLDMGHAVVDSSFLVWGMTPGTPVEVPCAAHLILGAESGPILVDSGMRDPDALTATSGIPFTRSADQTLEANLDRHDLRAQDIQTVVFTHLHLDHTGGVDQLPNARMLIQRRELQYAAAPVFPVPFYDRVDIPKLVGPLFDQVELLDGDLEIAPGVRTFHTGGHSPGHQMIEVDVDSGLAIICGDIAYLVTPAVSDQIPSGYTTNIEEAIRALARLKRDAVHVLPMHDIALWDKYPDGVR